MSQAAFSSSYWQAEGGRWNFSDLNTISLVHLRKKRSRPGTQVVIPAGNVLPTLCFFFDFYVQSSSKDGWSSS